MATPTQMDFHPSCRPMLVGSFPHDDHDRALDLVMEYTPDYPVWPQLPVFPQEGMMQQFILGLPGLSLEKDKVRVDVDTAGYDADQLAFYEQLLAGGTHAFALGPDTAKGIFALVRAVENAPSPPLAVKGQVVGPFTQAVGAKDMAGRALYFDLQQREAVTGLLAARAAWQVKYFREKLNLPVILFIDEPGLAGFGSSAFIGVGRGEVVESLAQVIDAIHGQGGIAGIHVCGNTDWGMVMESGADLINFDASAYLDRLLLYGDELKKFVEGGGCLAWGMVPTANGEDIARARVADMEADFHGHVQALCDLGLDRAMLMKQSVITPACGLGTRSKEEALRVLTLTRDLSQRLRSQ